MWSESTLHSCEPSRWTWSLVDVGWGRSSWNSKKGLFLFLSAVFQVSISLQNPDNLKVDWLYFHFFLQIKLFSNAARNCPEITCICSSESHTAASLRVDRLHVWWEQQRRGSLLPAAPLIPEVMVAMAMMARRRPHDSVICRGCAFRFEWCGRRRESESHTWVPDGCPLFPPAHCPRSAPLPRDPIAHTPFFSPHSFILSAWNTQPTGFMWFAYVTGSSQAGGPCEHKVRESFKSGRQTRDSQQHLTHAHATRSRPPPSLGSSDSRIQLSTEWRIYANLDQVQVDGAPSESLFVCVVCLKPKKWVFSSCIV